MLVAVAQSRRIDSSEASVAGSSPDGQGLVRQQAVSETNDADLAHLCDSAAREVRRFTGYDRVMVYQFDRDDNGSVIAESRSENAAPFLGLHYPASDIPAQARALFLSNRVRMLENVSNVPVPLLAADRPDAKRPLDMSSALLRSVSPIHLQYLRNMGVEATLAVSIIVDGKLWGLVACHHMSPKWASFAMRAACDMLSEFISVQVAVQESYARARARVSANVAQETLIHRLMVSGGRLEDAMEQLLSIIPYGGVAVMSQGQVYRVGIAPPIPRVRDLARWFEVTPHEGHVSSFDCMVDHSAAFADIADVASGVLTLDIGGASRGRVFWFRPEQAQTVRWAGVPTKAMNDSAGVPRLSPRGSFEEWIEERRGHAQPWANDELVIAEAIRGALVEVVLELLETRQKMARLEYVRVRSAVDAASDGMAITDAKGRTIYVNSAFAALTGFAFGDTINPDTLFARAPSNTPLPTADLPGDEVIAVAADGTRVPVSLRVDPIRDDDGLPAGTIFMITDQRTKLAIVEERKQLALRLSESQRLESLGILAGGVAHDFNNLLTTISGNAALALSELPANSAVQESLSAIERAVEHAAGLCRQLLAYAGKGQLVLMPLDVNELTTDLVRLLRSSLGVHHNIECHLAAHVAPVDGDQTQLRQVIMNLIINGSEAIGGGDGHIDVRTAMVDADQPMLSSFLHGETLAVGRYVQLQVADSGRGMDSETMARIFDPFFSTKFAGRGLGLAAALGIVSGHRGGIRVESRPGKGTTFTLLLPVLESKAKAATAVPVAQRRIRGAGRTILLVDDDPTVRDMVRRILERIDFRVVQAGDGAEALRLFGADPARFAMVVSDVAMPVMGGAGLLQRLRYDGYDVPVLLFSGYSPEDVGAIVAGDKHAVFVEKPFGIDVLEVAMVGLFRKYSGVTPLAQLE